MSNAKKVATAIKRNVRAYSAGKRSYEDFTRINRAAWGEVAQGEMNIIGSPCAERHHAVSRLLGALALIWLQ
jgi:hypothetical protein